MGVTGTLVHAQRGAVAAGSPQAAQVAIDVLAGGGTAVDAAVAASAVQCVVEFPWCGLGGDLFLMVDHPTEGVVALNGSGAAPARPGPGLSGMERIPRFGPLSVAVPGLPLAWALSVQRFGSMPLANLLAPAVKLAYDGFTVDGRLAAAMAAVGPDLGDHPGLASLLDGNGRAEGERFIQPDLGRTLEALGRHGTEWFYRGDFAGRLAAHMRRQGGLLDEADLASHEAAWSTPLTIRYRGYTVFQHPPVSLGAAMLAQLRRLAQHDISAFPPGDPELIDLMVRCKVAALAETLSSFGVTAAPAGTDTTCLAVTDASGTTVTLIHSLFNAFGSREVVEGTGVILNDRLATLRVDDGPGPRLQLGERPLHTLNSYIVKRGDRVAIAGATPGGRGQVQTNTQVLVNLIDHGMSPLSAVEYPRWLHGTPRRYIQDSLLHLERGLPVGCAQRLAELGHEVREVDATDDLFGSCTVVGRTPCTGLYAVADGRRGAAAAGW